MAGTGLLGEALGLEPVSVAQPHGASLVFSVPRVTVEGITGQ